MGHNSQSETLREVMRCFPTGVTVVAVVDAQGAPWGLTVNSLTSLSLDPPLVLVCIGHETSSHGRLVGASGFAISILSARQRAVARRFASEPSEGRFDGVPWRPAPSGNPILSEAAGWIDCALDEVRTGGDHSILIARVVASASSDAPPLVFHRGALGSIGA
jgi:flavin reductase (DIM6/NTAB) family NADH-FMN oxidoreductase RutF